MSKPLKYTPIPDPATMDPNLHAHIAAAFAKQNEIEAEKEKIKQQAERQAARQRIIQQRQQEEMDKVAASQRQKVELEMTFNKLIEAQGIKDPDAIKSLRTLFYEAITNAPPPKDEHHRLADEQPKAAAMDDWDWQQ